MSQRSWLFVPGDNEDGLNEAVGTGADVIVVDLEDSVASHAKSTARHRAARWLHAHRTRVTEQKLGRWVRINSLESGLWRDDLVALLPAAPDGVFLPKAEGPEHVRQLAAEIYELEQRSQVPSGSVKIIPFVSETPRAAMTIGAYVDSLHQRMTGLTWGVSDLLATIGAFRCYAEDGGWTDTFRFVRAQTLLAAHACGVMAIDTLHGDLRNEAALRKAAHDARSDGFAGMLAVHPDQVPIINEAFATPEDEIVQARKIVEAFADNPGSGILEVDGRLVDQPHLTLARRMLHSDGGTSLQKTPMLRPA